MNEIDSPDSTLRNKALALGIFLREFAGTNVLSGKINYGGYVNYRFVGTKELISIEISDTSIGYNEIYHSKSVT